MWLNIKFYDGNGGLLEEIGEWGELPTTATNPVDGQPFKPWSIVDLDNPKLKVYEVHPAMTQEWAAVLRSVGYPADMPLSFDRLTGAVDYTLGELAAQAPGTYHETFHFVLNNYVAFDNRIPPYRMSYDEAQKRNSLPVPAAQYGVGTAGSVYNHWDEVDLSKIAPSGAKSADLTLYYQGTSWEYVQFLNNAVDTTDDGLGAPNPVTPFLAEEGQNYLDAWVNADSTYGALGPMVPPYTMATAKWKAECVADPAGETCDDTVDNDCDGLIDCNDPDCTGDPACPDLIEWPHCFDGLDNDFDGLTDCADRTDCDDVSEPNTCGVGVCASTGSQTCRNGTLEDTCTPGTPTEAPEATCDDGLDNDCDGLTDTADPDCVPPTVCADYPDKGSCNNDPNCEWVGSPKSGSCQDAVVCVPEAQDEVGLCGDGIDNDCDGFTDCADADDCGTDPICQVDCSVYTTRNLCNAQTACTWDNKNKVCVNN